MQSRQAFILATLVGAVALLTCLIGFISLEFLQTAQRYAPKPVETEAASMVMQAPILTTRVQGSFMDIVELDKRGQAVRTVYSSDLKDQVADFSLFAVPQTGFVGEVFVQALQDIPTNAIILYRLDVVTGKIAAAVVKANGQTSVPSPDQTKVAVVNTSATESTVTVIDLFTGATLRTWNTEPGEFHTWTSNTCFERVYCLE